MPLWWKSTLLLTSINRETCGSNGECISGFDAGVQIIHNTHSYVVELLLALHVRVVSLASEQQMYKISPKLGPNLNSQLATVAIEINVNLCYIFLDAIGISHYRFSRQRLGSGRL